MSDSDDYFDNDDIVLDDETLAVLDSVEQKFHKQPVPKLSPQAEQPSKRRKTSNGWKPGLGSRALSDTDDLPDIIIENDWYGGVPVTRPRSPPRPPPSTRQPQRPAIITNHKPNSTGTRASPSEQQQTRQRWPAQPTTRQHSPVQQNLPSQPTRLSASQQRHPSQSLPRQASQNGTSQINRRASAPLSQSQRPSPAHTPPLQPSQRLPPTSVHGTAFAEELAEVQRKLAELREENEKMQKSLQENLDARYAKEGEVTILRKGMEKTAQEHAQQIAKLKAEKEEADAKRVQMQKEKDLEIERMRSHLQIKRQELESSVRKLPGSGRQRKYLPPEGSHSFSQVPQEIKSWNPIPGPSNVPDEMLSQVPQTPGLGRPRRKMAPPKETLPGFFNSFATKTPLISRTQRAHSEIDASPSLRRLGNRSSMQPPSPPSSPIRPLAENWNPDVQIDEGPAFTQPIFEPNAPVVEQDLFVGPSRRPEPASRRNSDATERSFEDEFSPPEGPDRFRIELTRVIIGCTTPSTSEPILRTLMTAQILDGTTPGGRTYGETCARFLDSLSLFSSGAQPESSLAHICQALVDIGSLMHHSFAIIPLASLFHLCSSICDISPMFCKCLFNADQGPNAPFGVVQLLAQTLMEPSNTDFSLDTSEWASLIRAAFRFIHSLIRHISAAQQERLNPLGQGSVWTTLLGEKQPHWLLLSTIRTLTSLATFPEFSKAFFAALNPQQSDNVIDVLCIHLAKDAWEDEENHTLILATLTCFGALATAVEVAAESILDSISFLSRILVLINSLTVRLWDDDCLCTEKIETSLHLLDTAIYLLYSLVFTDPSSPHDLRSRLISRRINHQFNGTFELFMVSFSRLTHDEYPDWIGASNVAKLKTISEFANILLGEIVDGDEIDLVWQAYQMTIEDPEQSLNDEELEAMKHSI